MEILEAINIEKNNYYRKRKEAILLFRIPLWGYDCSELESLLQLRSYSSKK